MKHSREQAWALVNAAGERETPFLLLDRERIQANCRRFKSAFAGERVLFSVKANNAPEFLQIAASEGVDFDVASWGEIDLLMRLGIPPARMIFSAPTKRPADIARAAAAGVQVFACDTTYEVEKLASFAPGCAVMLRVAVSNTGASWPLERKFGIAVREAPALAQAAAENGLRVLGLAFHVGSQNTRPRAWREAVEQICPAWQAMRELGLRPRVINLGGGFPVEYDEPAPEVESIAAEALAARAQIPGGADLWVEPGRGLAGDTGIMVTTVINIADREGLRWVYLDTGTFHGLVEGMKMFGFHFPVLTERDGSQTCLSVLAGPTCDSADVIGAETQLPANLRPGDRVLLLTTGAYTNSIARYNGMDYPPVVMV